MNNFDKELIQYGVRQLHNKGIELTPDEYEISITNAYNFIRKVFEMFNIATPKDNMVLYHLLSAINQAGQQEQQDNYEQ